VDDIEEFVEIIRLMDNEWIKLNREKK